MVVIPVHTPHQHPDPGAPDSSTPALSVLLARKWSRSRQLFVILTVMHRPSRPSLPPPPGEQEKGENHPPEPEFTKKIPTSLSGTLQGQRVIREQLLSSLGCVLGLASKVQVPVPQFSSWHPLFPLRSLPLLQTHLSDQFHADR